MKILIVFLILITGCGKDDPASTSVVADTSGQDLVSCGTFTLANDLQLTTYSGQIVVTSGNCGENYTIVGDTNYNVAGSATGYRFVSAYLQTAGGNVNFISGNRWQTIGSLSTEGGGADFPGTDHTTCQADLGINSIRDEFHLELTAEFDSSCNSRLSGTFIKRTVCVNAQKISLCSGTVRLIK